MASRIDLVDQKKRRIAAGMPTLGDTRENVSTLPGEPELAKDAYGKLLKAPEKAPRAPAVTPAEKPLATPAPTVPTSKYIGMDFDEAMQDGGIKPEDFWKLQEKAYKEGKRGGYSITDIINRVKSRDPDYETPEQKKKREKEEAISRAISGLGNVISNAANFAFAVRGAVPGVYNNQATDERLKRIQEKREALKRKYDTILMNAELGDVAYQRDMEAAREKAARDQALKERIKEIEHKYKMGEISSEAAFDLQQEALKQQGYMARTVFNAEARAKEGAKNRANAREVASIRSSRPPKTESKDKDFSYWYGSNNEEFKIPKSKEKGLAANVYRLMQKYLEEHPDDQRKLDDIKITIGEGGDISSKTVNTVMRKLQDFPELNDQVRKIIKYSESAAGENGKRLGITVK